MKPHRRKSLDGWWTCSARGSDALGTGNSPVIAYLNWEFQVSILNGWWRFAEQAA